jgi:hypothetical protein
MATTRTLPKSIYYSGQGKIIFGERDPLTGRPINAYEIGNAPAMELQISTTQVDHKESMSGQRATDVTLVTEKSATLNVTIESLDPRNLAAAFYGKVTDSLAGTVTAEQHTVTSSANGGLLILNHSQVEDVILTAAGTAVPAAAYFLDPEFGTLQWDPTYTPVITGAVSASYGYGAAQRLDALTVVAPPERYVRFHGINTIDDSLVLVEIPRAQFQPLQSLPLINDEIAQVQMTATILPDPFLNDGGSRYYRQTTLRSDV